MLAYCIINKQYKQARIIIIDCIIMVRSSKTGLASKAKTDLASKNTHQNVPPGRGSSITHAREHASPPPPSGPPALPAPAATNKTTAAKAAAAQQVVAAEQVVAAAAAQQVVAAAAAAESGRHRRGERHL